MTKDEAVSKAGSKAALARLLGVSRSAVSQWGEQMPRLQVYRLKEIRPRWFRREKP